MAIYLIAVTDLLQKAIHDEKYTIPEFITLH